MTTALVGGFFLKISIRNRVFEPYCTPGILPKY
jgi:hypothetical protein